MQDYQAFAEKNGVTLRAEGPCQFCGAQTTRGIHECLEIFNLGFQGIDLTDPTNHLFRFFIVDAHTLQHPEIHGRWSNHFHLTRLHLIFAYQVQWSYKLSPVLSHHLNQYKSEHPDEYFNPPPALQRGAITTTDILKASENQVLEMIEQWALEVYSSWSTHHGSVDPIAKLFLSGYRA